MDMIILCIMRSEMWVCIIHGKIWYLKKKCHN